MERLRSGIHCYLCCAAPSNTRMPGDGQIRNGSIFFNKEVTRKDFIQYCVNSEGLILYVRAIQGHPGGAKVDPTCWTLYTFRAYGVNTFITLVVPSLCIPLLNRE